MKFLAELALKGPGQAIGLIVALALLGLMLPPTAILSSAVAGLVCLQADAKNASLVIIASTLLASVLGGFLAAMPLLGVVMAMVLWAPVAATAMWLRRSGSLSQAMLMAALFGVGVVLVLDSAVADFDAAWQNLIQEMLANPEALGAPQADLTQLQQNLEKLGPLLPGLLGMSIMLTLQLALVIARWMQSQLLKVGAFGAEYRQLSIGRLPTLLIAAVLAAALLSNATLWQSMALVVGWLPVTQGIAIMHAFCGRPGFSQGKPLLVLGWVLLIFLPHFVVLLAALGAVDNWLNFRQRWVINPPEGNDSQDSEK
jgi:hypothetical protein